MPRRKANDETREPGCSSHRHSKAPGKSHAFVEIAEREALGADGTTPRISRFLALALEIDTLAECRKTLYPLRKLTIFNGVLIFEARLVDEMPSMQSISALGLLTTIGDATWRTRRSAALPIQSFSSPASSSAGMTKSRTSHFGRVACLLPFDSVTKGQCARW
jgi:hypothetical protein